MRFGFCWLVLGCLTAAQAGFAFDLETVKNLRGCFQVDYSYSETEVLDPDYTLDPRVYDSARFTVKEWVDVVAETNNAVRLQHFMQAESFAGEPVFMMRHHAEIWRNNPLSRFKYVGRFDGNDRWQMESLERDAWVREITNLDDGLRYQCLGQWLSDHRFPRFECAAYAPIPGRETRDMGRSDYNTLDRTAQVTVYGESWLERQQNIKTVFDQGQRRELVREVGKIWSTRLPDSECQAVQDWASERQPFWDLLAQAWDEAKAGQRNFHEIKTVDGTTRGAKINELMAAHYQQVASDPDLAARVYEQLVNVIEAHRE